MRAADHALAAVGKKDELGFVIWIGKSFADIVPVNLDEVGDTVFYESGTNKWSGGAVMDPRKIKGVLEQAGHSDASLVQLGGKSAPPKKHFDFSDETTQDRHGRIGVEAEDVELNVRVRVRWSPGKADCLDVANDIEVVKRLLQKGLGRAEGCIRNPKALWFGSVFLVHGLGDIGMYLSRGGKRTRKARPPQNREPVMVIMSF